MKRAEQDVGQSPSYGLCRGVVGQAAPAEEDVGQGPTSMLCRSFEGPAVQRQKPPSSIPTLSSRARHHEAGRRRLRAGGFSLLTALFLLVVVAGVGGYLVNLSVTSHLGSALAGQESRAYYAALSGLEWVAYAINNDSDDPPDCPAVGTSFAVEGFTVRLTGCSRTYPITEVSGDDYALYDVTVEAVFGSFGDWDYTRRSVRATLSEVAL